MAKLPNLDIQTDSLPIRVEASVGLCCILGYGLSIAAGLTLNPDYAQNPLLGTFGGCYGERRGLDSVLALVLVQHGEIDVFLDLIIRLLSRAVLPSLCFKFNLKIIGMTGFDGERLGMGLLTDNGAEVMHARLK